MTPPGRLDHGAPAAIGPYSQAIVSGDLVFCSGQLGLDPATGELVEGGVEAQAERALRNLGAVLDAAGRRLRRRRRRRRSSWPTSTTSRR